MLVPHKYWRRLFQYKTWSCGSAIYLKHADTWDLVLNQESTVLHF